MLRKNIILLVLFKIVLDIFIYFYSYLKKLHVLNIQLYLFKYYFVFNNCFVSLNLNIIKSD